MPVNELTRWTVYGRRRVSVDLSGRIVTAGFHADRLISHEAAIHMCMSGYLKYGDALDAVVVELLYGHDKHDERRVIHRVGQGRSWWE